MSKLGQCCHLTLCLATQFVVSVIRSRQKRRRKGDIQTKFGKNLLFINIALSCFRPMQHTTTFTLLPPRLYLSYLLINNTTMTHWHVQKSLTCRPYSNTYTYVYLLLLINIYLGRGQAGRALLMQTSGARQIRIVCSLLCSD